MFSERANLNKIGITRLDELGALAVIANRTLHERHQASRFAVVNTSEEWVYGAYLRAQTLYKQGVGA